jgi:hypothetical protein
MRGALVAGFRAEIKEATKGSVSCTPPSIARGK